MSKTETLSIDLLRLDAGTQARVKTSEETVVEYAELLTEKTGWPFNNPVDVFHDGTDYFVADGFHRVLAANRVKRASVPCRLHNGTAHDAKIFGMTANDQHGLRMSRADKRSCVEWLLDNGGKMKQEEIAQKAGVGVRTVKRIVGERKEAEKGPMAPLVNTEECTESEKNTENSETEACSVESSDNDDVPFDVPETADLELENEDNDEEFPDDETMTEICQRETTEIESWARKFGELLKDAQKALSDVPTLDELNARDGWERKLKEALATLRGTKPVVCPICQGDGNEKCPCGGHGRVTKQKYGQMV